jgi:hypothetical protein
MYYKGVLVATSATLALDKVNYFYGPTWLASGYSGPVDEVDVYNYDDPATGADPHFTGWYVTMDDVTYEPYTGSGAFAPLGGLNRSLLSAFTSFATDSFAAVPEPGAWAFLLIGVAVSGAGMRRRRATA